MDDDRGYAALGAAALQRVVDAVEPGHRLMGSAASAGGISSMTTMLDVERPDGTGHRFVLRRRLPSSASYAMSVASEVDLLRSLRARGLPVPHVRLVSLDGSLVPEPCCVLDHLDGEQRFAADGDPVAFGAAFADPLAAIHALDGGDPAFAALGDVADRFTPWLERPPERHDRSMGEGRIVDALRPHWPPPPPPRRALLHGDYWPGNLLWTGDRITAVIDWSDAVVGDPLADVATLRLDLRFTGGRAAAEAFTARYVERTGIDAAALPLWELAAALRPCGYVSAWAADLTRMGGDVTSASMRADHAAFVDEALARHR